MDDEVFSCIQDDDFLYAQRMMKQKKGRRQGRKSKEPLERVSDEEETELPQQMAALEVEEVIEGQPEEAEARQSTEKSEESTEKETGEKRKARRAKKVRRLLL